MTADEINELHAHVAKVAQGDVQLGRVLAAVVEHIVNLNTAVSELRQSAKPAKNGKGVKQHAD